MCVITRDIQIKNFLYRIEFYLFFFKLNQIKSTKFHPNRIKSNQIEIEIQFLINKIIIRLNFNT